jgi:hypothetical protein
MIARITDAYVRHYPDNGQSDAYVEWIDDKGQSGRTVGPLFPCAPVILNTHMTALFARANREGIAIRGETWYNRTNEHTPLIAAAPALLEALAELASTYHGTVYLAECGRGYPPSHHGLFKDCSEGRCVDARAVIEAAKGDA